MESLQPIIDSIRRTRALGCRDDGLPVTFEDLPPEIRNRIYMSTVLEASRTFTDRRFSWLKEWFEDANPDVAWLHEDEGDRTVPLVGHYALKQPSISLTSQLIEAEFFPVFFSTQTFTLVCAADLRISDDLINWMLEAGCCTSQIRHLSIIALGGGGLKLYVDLKIDRDGDLSILTATHHRDTFRKNRFVYDLEQILEPLLGNNRTGFIGATELKVIEALLTGDHPLAGYEVNPFTEEE